MDSNIIEYCISFFAYNLNQIIKIFLLLFLSLFLALIKYKKYNKLFKFNNNIYWNIILSIPIINIIIFILFLLIKYNVDVCRYNIWIWYMANFLFLWIYFLFFLIFIFSLIDLFFKKDLFIKIFFVILFFIFSFILPLLYFCYSTENFIFE